MKKNVAVCVSAFLIAFGISSCSHQESKNKEAPGHAAPIPLPGASMWNQGVGTSLATSFAAALNSHDVKALQLLMDHADPAATKVIEATKGRPWTLKSEKSATGIGTNTGVMDLVLNDSKKDIPLKVFVFPAAGRWCMQFNDDDIKVLKS